MEPGRPKMTVEPAAGAVARNLAIMSATHSKTYVDGWVGRDPATAEQPPTGGGSRRAASFSSRGARRADGGRFCR